MSVTEPSLEEQLLAGVPADGTSVGNKALREQLGWDEDTYWKVRNQSIAGGRLEKGRGKGGSVKRVVASEALEAIAEQADEVADEARELYEVEAQLYEPMRDVIANAWAKSRGITPTTVEITARQGKRDTGGRWTRPDIVSVAVQTFPHLPGKFIEVVTFEIKPSDDIDVIAVYEALAHRRSATHAYVVLHVPVTDEQRLAVRIDELASVARSHGVGVIVASDPADYDTWDERESAERVEPDPARLDQFIASQLSGKADVATAVR
jgi:hypothetical protein